jgi:hypothetical protein
MLKPLLAAMSALLISASLSSAQDAPSLPEVGARVAAALASPLEGVTAPGATWRIVDGGRLAVIDLMHLQAMEACNATIGQGGEVLVGITSSGQPIEDVTAITADHLHENVSFACLVDRSGGAVFAYKL